MRSATLSFHSLAMLSSTGQPADGIPNEESFLEPGPTNDQRQRLTSTMSCVVLSEQGLGLRPARPTRIRSGPEPIYRPSLPRRPDKRPSPPFTPVLSLLPARRAPFDGSYENAHTNARNARRRRPRAPQNTNKTDETRRAPLSRPLVHVAPETAFLDGQERVVIGRWRRRIGSRSWYRCSSSLRRLAAFPSDPETVMRASLALRSRERSRERDGAARVQRPICPEPPTTMHSMSMEDTPPVPRWIRRIRQ
uniref:Uncharacterized protein n=1 Tax=Mycena chlorophos TaxID=658473 RepID=A0ABQ0LZD4_MYCCL|nr:predicted protein [Mycena chlorophos]